MTTKFLIIRFSSIGDIVLTSPVIRCIKEQFDGEAEIHFITKKKFGYLVKNNPHLAKVIEIDEKVSEVKSVLTDEGYDFVVDLHNNIRSAQVKRLVYAPSFTFNKLNFQKWLKVNFKIDNLPNQHIVERYIEPLGPFEINYDGKGLDYFLPNNLKFSLSNFGLIKNEYVAVSLGGTYATKRYPKERLIQLIEKISGQVVLIGGKEDEDVAKAIVSTLANPPKNLAGQINVNESAYIISNAKAIVANDTGMMHIAAAFKKPMASIWGNTIPEFGMYPLYPKNATVAKKIFEVKGLSCRPCSKLGYASCPKKHFKCMHDINPTLIAEFINLLR